MEVNVNINTKMTYNNWFKNIPISDSHWCVFSLKYSQCSLTVNKQYVMYVILKKNRQTKKLNQTIIYYKRNTGWHRGRLISWKTHLGERERNVLLNYALNTFYLRLYGITHMVKDHSDSEKGNPLPPHRLILSINSKGSFICTIHITDRITHTTAFVTPVVEHWLEREIAQCVHPMKDRSDDPSHHERTL